MLQKNLIKIVNPKWLRDDLGAFISFGQTISISIFDPTIVVVILHIDSFKDCLEWKTNSIDFGSMVTNLYLI